MKAESRMKKKKHRVSEEPASYQNGEIVLYQTPDGNMNIDVRLEKETLWMDAQQWPASLAETVP